MTNKLNTTRRTFRIMQLILSFFVTLSIALISVGAHSKIRHLAIASLYLSEQHEYELNRIISQDTISIVNVDYQQFRPPYLTEFCQEIKTVTEEIHDSPIKILETLEQRFQETAYKEYNFPRTYRADVPIVVTIEDLIKYNKTFCRQQSKDDQKTAPILFVVVGAFAMIVLMFMNN